MAAVGIADACRRDSRRYYSNALRRRVDALEDEADALRDLLDDLRTERFYDGAGATRDALRAAVVGLRDIRAIVSRAHELLPPAVRP